MLFVMSCFGDAGVVDELYVAVCCEYRTGIILAMLVAVIMPVHLAATR